MSDILHTVSETIKKHISEKVKNNWGESGAAVSFRIPQPLDYLLDEMSISLERSKAELILWFIESGATALEAEIQNTLNSDNSDGMILNYSKNAGRAFMLNTNYNNNKGDHFDMLRNQEASAFCESHKYVIDKLQDGDRVYLYQSNNGIVATGIVSGGVIKTPRGNDPEGKYSVKLKNFETGFSPIPAKQFKKLTGGGTNFRMVLIQLNKEQNEALLKNITDQIE